MVYFILGSRPYFANGYWRIFHVPQVPEGIAQGRRQVQAGLAEPLG